jgi:hypothetical protein
LHIVDLSGVFYMDCEWGHNFNAEHNVIGLWSWRCSPFIDHVAKMLQVALPLMRVEIKANSHQIYNNANSTPRVELSSHAS